ncbi:T-cell leukemia translocation-altered gene protein [Vidua chalybeata]|nr:T-cell leukemia translocation-altered gene protein [Vidua chalybeata]
MTAPHTDRPHPRGGASPARPRPDSAARYRVQDRPRPQTGVPRPRPMDHAPSAGGIGGPAPGAALRAGWRAEAPPPRQPRPRYPAAMAAVAAGWQPPWRALAALGRELAAEWAAQDVRAALCQLLLLWLGISLLGVRLAWRAYGGAVAALCYRTGPAGRRSPGTASGASPSRPRAHSLSPAGPAGRNGAAERHCPPRDGPATEPMKTHRE